MDRVFIIARTSLMQSEAHEPYSLFFAKVQRLVGTRSALRPQYAPSCQK